MSVEYTYDEDRNVLHTRFFGAVTDKDLRDQAAAVASDRRVRYGVRELVDLSGIDEIDGSPSTFEDVIHSDRVHAGKLEGMRTAIVAPTDVLYGLSRMYKALAELMESPATVMTFRTVQEAEDWLGLRDTEV